MSSALRRIPSLCLHRRPLLHFSSFPHVSPPSGSSEPRTLFSANRIFKYSPFCSFPRSTCCSSYSARWRGDQPLFPLSSAQQATAIRLLATSARAEVNKVSRGNKDDVCLSDMLQQQLQQLQEQQQNEDKARRSTTEEETQPPIISFEAFDAYRRQILHLVELGVGQQRHGEFRSLRLANRSLCGLHAVFVLLLSVAPPTSVELLLQPHAQFCCLTAAQAAAVTFWGFAIARTGPLPSGGIAVLDWRLLVGLLYLFVWTSALCASFKDPQVSYMIQIPPLLLLLLLQQHLSLPAAAAVPSWWSSGSSRQLLLLLLGSVCAGLGRAVYVQRKFAEEIAFHEG